MPEHLRRSGKQRIKKMSTTATKDQHEFWRRPAACVRWRGAGVAALASIAIGMGIFPVAAAGSPQIQTSHTLYPPRPSVAHTQAVRTAATNPPSGLDKRKMMLTPEVRKRIAAARKSQSGKKAPPAKKGNR